MQDAARTTDTPASAAETVSFGFRDVPLGDKQGLVDDVFHKVAARYDLMNDLMSGGLHRVWKNALVTRINPPKTARHPFRVLDMAGGTGDVAFRILEASRGHADIIVGDINTSMLGVGRERAEKRGIADKVHFQEINAEVLPFEDGRFDAYTIAFGIRNVPRRQQALDEAYRVLKPGGRLFVLEFAPVETPLLDKIYDAFSFKVIPPMGRMVTGEAEPYQYLVESIRAFPAPERFKAEIRKAGFERVAYTSYSGGIAVLHQGVRL